MVANDLANHDSKPQKGSRSPADEALFFYLGITDLLPLHGYCTDDLRRVKVVCIGAGFSGVLGGIRFPQRIANLNFTIYEENEDVGGTCGASIIIGAKKSKSTSSGLLHEDIGKWEVFLEDIRTERNFTEERDFFISAVGILNEWKWPEIEGREQFKGKMVHSAY
ncbi:hypothetical protein CLAIMM_14546 [Cladophialophora immunda]|nr:hypothetical protein CLAIMM_14546 [Cladophialophora immunda]